MHAHCGVNGVWRNEIPNPKVIYVEFVICYLEFLATQASKYSSTLRQLASLSTKRFIFNLALGTSAYAGKKQIPGPVMK
jgi:hypothetical protein